MKKDNQAVVHFHGYDSKSPKDCLAYDVDYDILLLTYLVHLQNTHSIIKCVFKSGIKSSFISQLRSLNIMAVSLKCPALFISMAPANMDSSHFVVGVLFEGRLLLINPLGDRLNQDLIECLSEISNDKTDSHIVRRVYISSDKIQKDPKGQSSCGPICVEILKMLNQGPDAIKEKFQEWLSLSDEKEITRDKLKYFSVSVAEICVSDSLSNMTEENCQQVMEKIRQSHCEELTSLPLSKLLQQRVELEQVGISDQDAFLQAEVENSPEQVLLFKLAFDNLSLFNLEQEEFYLKLKNKLTKKISPFVSKSFESQFKIFKLKQDPLKLRDGWEIDVPGDDSCLFWCILFGYLLPVIDIEQDFSRRFLKAFGKNDEKGFVRKKMQEYNPLGNVSIFTDPKILVLVQKEFRARIIGEMSKNPAVFKDFHEDEARSQQEYNESMLKPSAWGGEREILAASMLLECNIILDNKGFTSQFPDPIDTKKPTINIKHVPFLKESDQEPKASYNHYHFVLSNKVMSKYVALQTLFSESPHLFEVEEVKVLDREDLSTLKEIFEQVLVNEILLEIKYTSEKVEASNLRESNSAVKAELETRMRLIAELLGKGKNLDKSIGSINRGEVEENNTDRLGKTWFVNLNLLKVALEVFATQASLRYEPYIAERISKYPLLGVIPLARIGARRVVEFLGRAKLFYKDTFEKMTFCDILLDGLIFGKSSRGENLKSEKNVVKVRTPYNEDEKEANLENNADAVLGRGGVCLLDPVDPYGIVKRVLYKPSSEFGVNTQIAVTKMIKKPSGIFPKYSFMLLERKVAERYIHGELDKYEVCREVAFKPSVHFATLDEMISYSRYFRKNNQKNSGELENEALSFIDWIKEKLPVLDRNAVASVWIMPISRRVNMEGKERISVYECLNLIGEEADEEVEFVISGDFTNVGMRGLDVRKVQFCDVELDGADCRYLNANKVTFRNVRMRNTRLECSDLRDALFVECVVVRSNLLLALIEGVQFENSRDSSDVLMRGQQEEEKRLEKDLNLELEESSQKNGNKLDEEYGLNDSVVVEFNVPEGTYHLSLNMLYVEKYLIQKLQELLQLKNALKVESSSKAVIQIIDSIILKLFRVYNRIKSNENMSEIDLYRIVPQFDILYHKSAIKDVVSKVKDKLSSSSELVRTKSEEILDQYGHDISRLDFIGDKGRRNPTVQECLALDQTVSLHAGSGQALLQKAWHRDSKKKRKPDLEHAASRDVFSQNPIKQVQMRFVNDSVLRKRLHDILFNIRGAMEKERDNCHPSCYLSYVMSEERNRTSLVSFKNFLIQLRIHLRLAGIQALLDFVDCKLDSDVKKYHEQIEKVDFVLMICTTSALKLRQNKSDLVTNPEFSLIMKKRNMRGGENKVIAIALMDKGEKFSFPVASGMNCLDNVVYWHKETYVKYLKQLIAALWSVPESHRICSRYWKDLPDEEVSDESQVRTRLNLSGSKALKKSYNEQFLVNLVIMLKAQYLKMPVVMAGASDFNDVYFDLMLVDQAQSRAGQSVIGTRSDFFLEAMYSKTGSLLALSRLVTHTEDLGYVPQRVLVEGMAGIGKTTLCKYIAYNWANSTGADRIGIWSDQFELVFYVQLKNILTYAEGECTVEAMIIKEFFRDSRQSVQASDVSVLLSEMREKILFIYDGFDEVEADYSLDQQDPLMSVRISFIENLINSKEYSYILTSRSDSVQSLRVRFDKKVVIVGFSSEEIRRYVHRYFRVSQRRGSDLQESLISVIQSNQNIMGISHVPINLELICEFWSQKAAFNSSITMTEFYNEIIEWIIKRNVAGGKKVTSSSGSDFEIRKRILESMAFLRQLAWEGTMRSTIFIDESECQEKPVGHNLSVGALKKHTKFLLSVGLLNCLRKDNALRSMFYFPHYTFQEYYAASFWVLLFSEGKSEEYERAVGLLRKNVDDQKFAYIWVFVVGILRVRKLTQQINEFFDILLDYNLKSSTEDAQFIRISLIIMCLSEVKRDEKSPYYVSCIEKVCNSIAYLRKNISDSDSVVVQRLVSSWKMARVVQGDELVISDIILSLTREGDIKSKVSTLIFISAVGIIHEQILRTLIDIDKQEEQLRIHVFAFFVTLFETGQIFVISNDIAFQIFKLLMDNLIQSDQILRKISLMWLCKIHWYDLPNHFHEYALGVLITSLTDRYDEAIESSIYGLDIGKFSVAQKVEVLILLTQNVIRKNCLEDIRIHRALYSIFKRLADDAEVLNKSKVVGDLISALNNPSEHARLFSIRCINAIFKNPHFKSYTYDNIVCIISLVCDNPCASSQTEALELFRSLLDFQPNDDSVLLMYGYVTNLLDAVSKKPLRLSLEILSKIYTLRLRKEDEIVEIYVGFLEKKDGLIVDQSVRALLKVANCFSILHAQKITDVILELYPKQDQQIKKLFIKVLGKFLRLYSNENQPAITILAFFANLISSEKGEMKVYIIRAMDVGSTCELGPDIADKMVKIVLKLMESQDVQDRLLLTEVLENISIHSMTDKVKIKFMKLIENLIDDKRERIQDAGKRLLLNIDYLNLPQVIEERYQRLLGSHPELTESDVLTESELADMKFNRSSQESVGPDDFMREVEQRMGSIKLSPLSGNNSPGRHYNAGRLFPNVESATLSFTEDPNRVGNSQDSNVANQSEPATKVDMEELEELLKQPANQIENKIIEKLEKLSFYSEDSIKIAIEILMRYLDKLQEDPSLKLKNLIEKIQSDMLMKIISVSNDPRKYCKLLHWLAIVKDLPLYEEGDNKWILSNELGYKISLSEPVCDGLRVLRGDTKEAKGSKEAKHDGLCVIF